LRGGVGRFDLAFQRERGDTSPRKKAATLMGFIGEILKRFWKGGGYGDRFNSEKWQK
jgi:hypothetical protein